MLECEVHRTVLVTSVTAKTWGRGWYKVASFPLLLIIKNIQTSKVWTVSCLYTSSRGLFFTRYIYIFCMKWRALPYQCCNSGVYLCRPLSSEVPSKPRDSSRASSKWWCYNTYNQPGKHDRTIFLQIHSLLSNRKKMILHLQLQYLFLGMTCLCRLPLLF